MLLQDQKSEEYSLLFLEKELVISFSQKIDSLCHIREKSFSLPQHWQASIWNKVTLSDLSFELLVVLNTSSIVIKYPMMQLKTPPQVSTG